LAAFQLPVNKTRAVISILPTLFLSQPRGPYVASKNKSVPPAAEHQKHVGDAIFIKAHDDMEVTGMTVSIVDSTQARVEIGTATFDAATDSWRYVATVDASAKSGLTVTANALDRPGNTGTLSAAA
jgi:hypothetical protein